MIGIRWPFRNHPEPYVWEVVKKGGFTFVEVGANFGEYSRRLWRKYRTIIAIEPNAEAFQTLRQQFGWRSWFTNFRPYECAASDHDGTENLYLNIGGVRCDGAADTIEPVSHYRPPSRPEVDKIWDHTTGDFVKMTVEARRLDTLLDWTTPPGIDMMTIDVELAEFRVLRGASGILDSVKNIIVELHDRERKGELERVLSQWGFENNWLDSDHIWGHRQA